MVTRFVVTYNNGKTLKEGGDITWETVPKVGITSISLVDSLGIQHTLSVPDINYGVFQHKVRHSNPKHEYPLSDSDVDKLENRVYQRWLNEFDSQMSVFQNDETLEGSEKRKLIRAIEEKKQALIAAGKPDMSATRPAQEVGFIYNKKGDCVILNVRGKDGFSKTYLDNAFDMALNFDIHGIISQRLEQ